MASQSPRKVEAVIPDDFSKEIKGYVSELKELFKIQKALHAAKAQKKGFLENWRGTAKITSQDVTALQNLLIKEAKHFARVYRSAYNRRRGAGSRKGGPNSGFRLPIAMKQELIDFLNAANLGSIGGRRLQEFLPFLNQAQSGAIYGIASRAVLTPLFSLYAELNNLSNLAQYNRERASTPEFMNRQLLGADETMLRYLGPTFANITARTAEKLRLMGVRDGDAKPAESKRRARHYFRDVVVNPATGKKEPGRQHPIWNDFYHVFSPNNFTYGNFQNIISELVYSNNPKSTTSTVLPASDPRAQYVGKVEKTVAEKYKAATDAGTEIGAAAASAVGATNPQDVFNINRELGVRMSLDMAFQIVRSALTAYSDAHPSAKKKSKKR